MFKSKRKSRYLAFLMVVALLAVSLAGCGSGEGAAQSGTSGETSDSGTPAKTKDTLIVANMYDAKSLDPHAAGDSASVNALHEITETLVEYNAEGELVPLLAEKWEQLDDRSWKFYLRKGVKFHNGEELKASDVVYSFMRATSPKGARVQYIMKAVDPEGLEIVDDYTVIVRTKEPFSPFLSYLPYIGAAIISEKYYEENGDAASMHPVGTGRFEFVEWKKGDRVILKRNDNYWGEKAAYENLIIRAITEANSRMIELETGGVDIAYTITANDIRRVEDNPDLELKRRLSTVFTFLGFNTAKAPLNDVKLRQAIDYAIDEEGIVAAVFRGIGVYTPGPVTPKQTYFDDSDVNSKYDPEKAKVMLKELGYESGLTLELLVNDRQERIDIAQIVQSQLQEVGITVEIKVLEWGAFLDSFQEGKHQMFISGWGAVGFPDPDNNLYGTLHSDQIPDNNYVWFASAELDDLLNRSRTLPNGPEREDVILKAQKLIRNEVPYLTFDNSEQIVGIRKEVKGFEPSSASAHKVGDVYFEFE